MEPSDLDIQRYLNSIGERRIDEDIQNKLREILKCAVCYEVPTEKGIKIRICEQGHHFCTDCFKKLRHCGICRGQFSFGRNFVVEEIITQLGNPFGLTKIDVPLPEQPVLLISDYYYCLHQCSSLIMAMHMLRHIRLNHPDHLFDNVRSNPYLKVFSCYYDIDFELEQLFVSSFQVSDMGLFTVMVNIGETHLVGSAHMLAKPEDILEYHCKLTLKINKPGYSNEFTVTDCDLFDYNYDYDAVFNSGKCLKMSLDHLRTLANEGEKMQMYFTVWRKVVKINKFKDDGGFTEVTLIPEDGIAFTSDRRKRRNKQRNLRKKRNREALRHERTADYLADEFNNVIVL